MTHKLSETKQQGDTMAEQALIDYELHDTPYWTPAAGVRRAYPDAGEEILEYSDGSYLITAIVGINNCGATYTSYDELIDDHPDCADYINIDKVQP